MAVKCSEEKLRTVVVIAGELASIALLGFWNRYLTRSTILHANFALNDVHAHVLHDVWRLWTGRQIGEL